MNEKPPPSRMDPDVIWYDGVSRLYFGSWACAFVWAMRQRSTCAITFAYPYAHWNTRP